LRLGVCRPADWSGSAVDFIEQGFKRFCNDHCNQQVKKVWVGDLRIMDCIFDLSARERDEAEAEAEGSKTVLYLVGDYEAAASIPIGASLPHLEREHELLPAAFYEVFTTNLWKWMRVYDYAAAKEHAAMWTDGLSEEEIKESVYPKVESELPACIGKHGAKRRRKKALPFLHQIYPVLRSSIARSLVKHVLEMDARGRSLNPVIMLWAHLGMGNKEEALADLEKAYSEHLNNLTTLKVDPAFDSLRSDPRFQDLLRRVGLAQ